MFDEPPFCKETIDGAQQDGSLRSHLYDIIADDDEALIGQIHVIEVR